MERKFFQSASTAAFRPLTEIATPPTSSLPVHPDIAEAQAFVERENQRYQQRLEQYAGQQRAQELVEEDQRLHPTIKRNRRWFATRGAATAATVFFGYRSLQEIQGAMGMNAENHATVQNGIPTTVIEKRPLNEQRQLISPEEMTEHDTLGMTFDGTMLFIPYDKVKSTQTGQLQGVEVTYSQVVPAGMSLVTQEKDDSDNPVHDDNFNPVLISPSMKIKEGIAKGAIANDELQGYMFPVFPFEVDEQGNAIIEIAVSERSSDGKVIKNVRDTYRLPANATVIKSANKELEVISQLPPEDYPDVKQKSKDILNLLTQFNKVGLHSSVYITPFETDYFLMYDCDRNKLFSPHRAGFILDPKMLVDPDLLTNMVFTLAMKLPEGRYSTLDAPVPSTDINRAAYNLSQICEDISNNSSDTNASSATSSNSQGFEGYHLGNQENIDSWFARVFQPESYQPSLRLDPFTAISNKVGTVETEFANWLTLMMQHPDIFSKKNIANNQLLASATQWDMTRKHYTACRGLYEALDPNHILVPYISDIDEVLRMPE